MKGFLLAATFSVTSLISYGQDFLQHSAAADHWVDSVFQKLSFKKKVGQLMVIRESNTQNGKPIFYEKELKKYIHQYGIGSICPFQGGAVEQALILNELQQKSKIPLMVCIDGEMGLGMRVTAVDKFPDQLTMGAMDNPALVYTIGEAMAEQCKRLGIQVDYAPVIDINNNPNNPVIGYRSFGQDKWRVAQYGVQIMKGLQSKGVMATAKHFPGHGDVAVDSHLDLPVINKSLAELDTMELIPFKEIFKAGVGSVMIAHLSIPAIDSTPNLATSLSAKNVNGLLRQTLGFKGISFTDALEMKGVAKFFPQGKAGVQSLIAGNDMLCLPGDVKGTIKELKKAIKEGRFTEAELDERVKKVLLAKYNLGLSQKPMVDTANLLADLNKEVPTLRAAVALNAMTLLRLTNDDILNPSIGKVAYVALGTSSNTTIGNAFNNDFKADQYNVSYKSDANTIKNVLSSLKAKKYDKIYIGVHDFSKRPANNFGIPDAIAQLANDIDKNFNAATVVFGNPYAAKFFLNAKNLVVAYEDDSIFQKAAFNALTQQADFKGHLPVTVSEDFPFNYGVKKNDNSVVYPASVGMNADKLLIIDSIVNGAIADHAFPGCEVLIARKGRIAFYKNYGYLTYDSTQHVATKDLYDIASCTKISATTVSIMRLVEEGKVSLEKTIGDYLPVYLGSDKANMTIRNVLLHQAGFLPDTFFDRDYLDKNGNPLPGYFSSVKNDSFSVTVTDKMFFRKDLLPKIDSAIRADKLGPKDKYVYSDNDFIILGEIVQKVSGLPLDQYAAQNFYKPLGMSTTTFLPLEHGFQKNEIAPTEFEKTFRQQQLWGTVHDPRAALMGGVAGHAGLFTDAMDLSKLYLMLLNGGTWQGQKYFQKSTIDQWTSYNSNISHRGLGFDKPYKDNATEKNPYPSRYASPQAFGHTGYTGTCVWADPKEELLLVFLSNRVYPDGGSNLKLSRLKVRENILDAAYQAILH
ncbi:MAG: serine hydrolase [Pseudopedobacter saltans]|uniref:beta-N-acetylhexosaminidase n=1 Tax=Pseudopedobacter saltans TaxID=151895 RepID=A0A2W5F7H4_9SPHI|nr:MAG: serine hydrolase [Pseudopedobacter saltans]